MHSTSNLNDEYLGSGKILKRSINKYGRENHKIEILEFLPDREALKKREKELITEDLLKDPMCINIAFGGEGGITYFDKKIRSSTLSSTLKKLWNTPSYQEWHNLIASNTFKRLHKEGKIKRFDWTGFLHSEESKRKIGISNSVKQKGNKNSQFGTCWIYNLSESIKINVDQLNEYLQLGWNKGRKLKF